LIQLTDSAATDTITEVVPDTSLKNAELIVDTQEEVVADSSVVEIVDSSEIVANPGVVEVEQQQIPSEINISSNYSADSLVLDSVVDSAMGETIHEQELDFTADELGAHVLITNEIEYNTKPRETEDWILGVLLLVLACIAWARVNHRRRLWLVLRAFLSKLYATHIIRENDSLMKRVSLVLNIVFLLVVSLFIYQISSNYGWVLPFSSYLHPFIIILISLYLIYQFKSLGLILVGILFNQREKFSEYRYNVWLMNQALGVLLLPIVISVAYLSMPDSVLINIGIILITLIYIYRLQRGITIGSTETNLSQFYLFLYLCTLEILPLVVLTKVFIDRI